MAIVAMKHLRLLGMESEREALLKAMQDMECVEISSIDGSEEALKSGFAKPDDKALMSAQEASRAYRTALASLDRFAPEKKGMFRKRQGVSGLTLVQKWHWPHLLVPPLIGFKPSIYSKPH